MSEEGCKEALDLMDREQLQRLDECAACSRIAQISLLAVATMLFRVWTPSHTSECSSKFSASEYASAAQRLLRAAMPSEIVTPSPLEGLPIWVNDANKVWSALRIARSIPLSRLEWLWNSRGDSLQESSASARAVFEVSTERTPVALPFSHFAHEWYSNPYVYTLVTVIQELVVSRDESWIRIRRFVDECKEKHFEYLVILAIANADLSQHKKVVDKLRAEVNTASRGRERLVVVPPAAIREEQRPITHLHHSPAHQDLLVRLRECVREGAEARVQAYGDEVSRSCLNQSAASWTFTKFFALKEGMAFVFVQLGRRDLAIRFYDELQVTMAEQTGRVAVAFCLDSGADSAMGVTNPDAKNYRRFLLDNSITEMDLRTYLFARQISLLLTDRKYADVAERGLKFITVLARRCAEEALSTRGEISAVFRDTWVFTAARALAAALTPSVPSPSEADESGSVQLGTSRERHTARLIAGFHVHALKAFQGLAYVTLPGCLGQEDAREDRDMTAIAEEAKATSNERLKSALSNAKRAEELYSEIANAAASLYEMGGRARGAAALDGDAGRVSLRNGNFDAAEPLLSAQCSRFCNDNGWDDLHRKQRFDLAQTEKELNKVQEYLVSCLAMLYMSRSTRRLWNRQQFCDNNENALEKDASHWISEAVASSARLPRMMKYRADRLFDISVLPNAGLWLEGDPGTAVVRIDSEVPATFHVDSVMLECRCTSDVPSAKQKSVLQNRGSGDSPSVKDGHEVKSSERSTMISSGSLQESSASDHSGMLTIRSLGPVAILPGSNTVELHTNEVPYSGRYKVTFVALFVGNLKLVQVANKSSSIPIATIRGSPAAKTAALSAPPALQSEFGTGELKYPMFFASKRTPAASILITKQQNLYLAPDSVQFVVVAVRAGQYGVQEGARLVCSILSTNFKPPDANTKFVTFDSASSIDSGSSAGTFRSERTSAGETSGPETLTCEFTIDKALDAGEVFEARLPLRLLGNCDLSRRHMPDYELDGRYCVLRMQLTCREKDGNSERLFTCDYEHSLTFSSPIHVSAHVDLNPEWGGEDVSRTIGLDGTLLGGGGSLLCTVQATVSAEDTILLKRVALVTPKWLELRPDERPAHVDVLPCPLGSGSAFKAVFDVLTREECMSAAEYGMDNAQAAVFDKDAIEKRLSRARASVSEIAESTDDICSWAGDQQSDAATSGILRNRASLTTVDDEFGTASKEHWEEMQDPPANISLESVGNRLTVSDAKRDFTDQEGGYGEDEGGPMYEVGENHEFVRHKDAQDVVDLSAPSGGSWQSSAWTPSSPGAIAKSNSTASLVIDFEVKGLHSVSTIERTICMDALRTKQNRYCIERYVKEIGECGKIMELRFALRRAMNSGTGHEGDARFDECGQAEVLQYEIDADPTLWLVVGRRKGKLNAVQGSTAVAGAKIIPLVAGRQRVPSVRLFSCDGRPLPFSRYENLNKFMQLVVIPLQTVLTSCSPGDGAVVVADGFNLEKAGRKGKGALPVVIASDSFFES